MSRLEAHRSAVRGPANGRLIVVSNRVAMTDGPRAGGLANALSAALDGQPCTWLGWSGRIDPLRSGAVQVQRAGGIERVTLDLSTIDHAEYYDGFANRSLWPLLHSRIDLVDYSRQTQAGYWRVNELFADTLAAMVHDDDTLWIHDYHFIPLAMLLRARGVRCTMGFFLHVPMPSSDLMAALPDHARVFEGLSSYDLVGLQTQRDLERFQDYVRLHGGGRVLRQGLLQARDGRHFGAGAFPIGIDVDATAALAAQGVHDAQVQKLAGSLHGRTLAIGADRLDYSKGLPERFAAFDSLFERHRRWVGDATLLQIAPHSRGAIPEYSDLRHQLERLAGHINGKHATADWTPIRYVNRDYPPGTLAGFQRLAKVGVVTSLRDGMNLVAKEYLAAQDPADPGVLVLSTFAGAARELVDALIVNPYDVDGVADAIDTALSMPLAERRNRWQASMRVLRGNDIAHWRGRYLDALGATSRKLGERVERSEERVGSLDLRSFNQPAAPQAPSGSH